MTLLMIALFSFFSTSAQVVYVKANANGDGSSWANATGDLKQALDAATNGTEIWVAKGTYFPTTCNACTEEDRNTYFQIADGVRLYGGFAGNESNRNQRNWETNPTILSGDIDRNGNLSNNSYTIVYTRNVTAATMIDGFTLTGGNASSIGGGPGDVFQSGAALFNRGSLQGFFASPTIRNCIFTNNKAISYGAAVFNDGGFSGKSSPSFENCSFINNESTNAGAAVYNNAVFAGISHPEFTNCNFSNNKTSNSAGAVYNNGAEHGQANPIFRFCDFTNNECDYSGGAVYSFGKNGTTNPAFYNCNFKNNTAILFGGAVVSDGSYGGLSSAKFIECEFEGNQCSSDGGAIFNLGSEGGVSSPRIEKCVFKNNHSLFAGAGIFNNGIDGESSPTIINCDFEHNVADTYGGAIYNQGKGGNSNPMIVNCLFFKNKGSSAGAVYNLGAEHGHCNPTITNCTFYGNEANVGGAIYSNATDETGNCSPVVTNCIIWGNIANFGEVFRVVYGTPNISYSLVGATDCDAMYSGVEGQITCGDGIIFNQNPLFVDAENGDLHLLSSSPVIDKGNNTAIASTGINVDLDSQTRNQNGKVDMGAYEFGTNVYMPPTIVEHPVSQSVCENEDVSFSVNISGTGPFTYQWQKNGNNIAGANNPILNLVSVNTENNGNYICKITGPQGENLNSNTANLAVTQNVSPSISITASTLEICAGTAINFVAQSENGGDNPGYQWKVNGASIGGGSDAVTFATLKNGDIIQCELTSSINCVTNASVLSNELQVVVHPIVVVSANLSVPKTSICRDEKITFTATPINGGNNPSYQWQINGANVGSDNNTFTPDTLRNGDAVRVILTSSETCVGSHEFITDNIIISVDANCTGVPTLEAIDETLVHLFPNPTTNLLNIQFKDLADDFSLNLLNLQGQLLYQKQLSLNGAKHLETLDLSDLPKGLYLIRLVNEQKALVKKIIKQ